MPDNQTQSDENADLKAEEHQCLTTMRNMNYDTKVVPQPPDRQLEISSSNMAGSFGVAFPYIKKVGQDRWFKTCELEVPTPQQYNSAEIYIL